MFTTVAFVSYAIAPDWMWMYFLAPSDVSWALPAIATGYVGMFLIGFAAATGMKPLGRGALAGAAIGALTAEVVVVAIMWSRYHLIGTKQEWMNGRAHELFTASPSGPVTKIGLLGPIFLVVFAVALFLTWRGRREAAAGR